MQCQCAYMCGLLIWHALQSITSTGSQAAVTFDAQLLLSDDPQLLKLGLVVDVPGRTITGTDNVMEACFLYGA